MSETATGWMRQPWAMRPGNGASPPAAPVPAAALSIAQAGVSQILFAAGTIPNVADIVNPPDATEPLYLDITGAGAAVGAGIALAPGQAYRISSPLPVAVSVAAASAGHGFFAVAY